MPKEVKTAAELDQLIADEFYGLGVVADDMRDDPRGNPKPPAAYWHEPLQGINWAARGGSNISAYAGALDEIVKRLQLKYDINE